MSIRERLADDGLMAKSRWQRKPMKENETRESLGGNLEYDSTPPRHGALVVVGKDSWRGDVRKMDN